MGRERGPHGSREEVAAVEAEGAVFHGPASELLNSFVTWFSSLL